MYPFAVAKQSISPVSVHHTLRTLEQATQWQRETDGNSYALQRPLVESSSETRKPRVQQQHLSLEAASSPLSKMREAHETPPFPVRLLRFGICRIPVSRS